MLGTGGKAETNSSVNFSYEILYMVTPVLANKQNLTFISSAEIQPKMKTDKDGWQDRVKGIHAISSI